MKQPSVAIVGLGRLGSALAKRLSEAGYDVTEIQSLKNKHPGELCTKVVWFCVPDSEVARTAKSYPHFQWHGRHAFHSSGVLASDVLAPLRDAGAHVASVHPLMTFVKGSIPKLAGVPFAIEGDEAAVRNARRMVRQLGGNPVRIEKEDKVAYHAFATLICPLLVSLLAASERVAMVAGINEREARRRMMPIICQTMRNYERLGPAASFSGPIVRGDVETIRAHLEVMTKVPAAKSAYAALARAALEYLPNHNRERLAELIHKTLC